MKTSEALRKGAEMVPQCSCQLFYYDHLGVTIQACAIGSLILARGEISPQEASSFLCGEFTDILNAEDAESYRLYEAHYGRTIWQDNDHHGLSREQIAERLEAIGR